MLKQILERLKSRSSSEAAVFEPCMPEVTEGVDLAQFFDRARAAAAADTASGRRVAIATPEREVMLQPCPPPGSMPSAQVANMERLIPPKPKRNIAAIAYTASDALRADVAKTIPFMGLLLGMAYIGHAVWVFEGHATALTDGCREADVLIVDGGMLAYLCSDWQAAASRGMRRPEIYIHDRATYKLQAARRPTQPTSAASR